MPYPGLLYPEPLPLQQSTADLYLHRRWSDTVPYQSLWGPWVLECTRFIWALWTSLAGKEFDSKSEFIYPTILLGFFWPWTWGISSWQLQWCAATTQTQFWISLCKVSGSWYVQDLFESSKCLWWVWNLILNLISPSYCLAGASPLLFDMWYLFLVGSNILLWIVVHQRVVILDFSQEKMSTYPSTPPSSSTILGRSNSGFVKVGPFCLCSKYCNSITGLSTQISLLCSWPALRKIDLITPSLQQSPAFKLGSYFLVPLCSQLSFQIYFFL